MMELHDNHEKYGNSSHQSHVEVVVKTTQKL